MKRIAFLAAAMMILTGCGANDDSSAVEEDESTVQDSITETSTTVTEQETTKATEPISEETSKDTSDIDRATEFSTELISEVESIYISETEKPEEEIETKLQIEVNGHTLTATLADNDSAKALAELMKNESLILELREYGSFEKVGPLLQSLPTNDESITTEPGDVMLYQGNQITIFYGTNTWSYTRLGHIDINQDELKAILGEGDVTVVLSLAN